MENHGVTDIRGRLLCAYLNIDNTPLVDEPLISKLEWRFNSSTLVTAFRFNLTDVGDVIDGEIKLFGIKVRIIDTDEILLVMVA